MSSHNSNQVTGLFSSHMFYRHPTLNPLLELFSSPLGIAVFFFNTIPTPWPKPDLTFPKVSHFDLETLPDSDSDSDDDDYVPLQVMKKKAHHKFLNNTNYDGLSLDFLHMYHDKDKPYKFRHYRQPAISEVAKAIRKRDI